MSYIDVTGKTEEEAIQSALAQLGMERDDVSVEILERAKSGFLGMGAKPARVRVTYGPDEAPMEEIAAPVKPAVVEKPVKKEEPKKPQRQPAALPRAVFFHRLQRVLGAGGHKPAAGRAQRRNGRPVKPYHFENKPLHASVSVRPSASSARRYCLSILA